MAPPLTRFYGRLVTKALALPRTTSYRSCPAGRIRCVQGKRSIRCTNPNYTFQIKRRITEPPREKIMSKERRVAPRKVYTVPVRFRVRTDVFAPPRPQRAYARGERAAATRPSDALLDGETVNISSRGIYFTSSEHVACGEELEMSLQTPRRTDGTQCRGRSVQRPRSSRECEH